jgi:hypothetical protein
MVTRGKRARRIAPGRKARRPAARNASRARRPAARAARRLGASRADASAAAAGARRGRGLTAAVRRSVRALPQSGWSTLRVVWRPAIAMAMLPVRVYRVYRWAEAESIRSAISASAP